MKLWLMCACVAVSTLAAPAPAPIPGLPWDIIDLAAISRMTPRELELLAEGLAAEEMIRTKRSSAQALQSVGKFSSGLSSKVGLLGQASAAASSFISSASSKGDEHGYSYEPHEEKPKYDFWGLKKSILNTLFQAVKAITGGVTILKGQLIKGGGALASVAGKIISVKGEAVSNLGKKIVNSAQLSPPKKHHGSVQVPVYGPPPPNHEYLPSAYGVPSAPAHYAPSGPSAPTGPGYSAPIKYTSHYEGRGKVPLTGLHAGLILLKPLDGDAHPDPHPAPSSGHTALEPPTSLLFNALKALKGVFSKTEPSPEPEEHEYPTHDDQNSINFPPPPPQPHDAPHYKPMESWGTPLNSYGEPAHSYFSPYADHSSYSPQSPMSYDGYREGVNAKHSAMSKAYNKKPKSLTPSQIYKLSENLDKIKSLQRSSEDIPLFDGMDLYRDMLMKHDQQSLANPIDSRVISSDAMMPNARYLNNEFSPDSMVRDLMTANGLSLENLPKSLSDKVEIIKSFEPTFPPTDIMTTTTSTTTTKPVETKTEDVTPAASRKSVKYVLRGNRIVQV